MTRAKQPIGDASLSNVGTSLANVAAAIAERLRHEGQGVPFKDFDEHLNLEALRLRGEGQNDLADALLALRNA